jgi:hypothetical protein
VSVLLFMLMLWAQAPGGKVEEMPYRVLRAELPKSGERFKETEFAVSIDRPLSRAAIEGLICRVLVKESPPKSDRLTIRVFVGLSEYVPPVESEMDEAASDDHQIAWYVWNPSLPRVRGRLVLMKDADGNPLDQWQSQEFNHPKVCRLPG